MSNKKPTDAELTQQYNQYKNELQSLAQKIGELESEVEEHKLVIDSISPLEPERKCFRMVGGVLVERTVKEVLPALETNYSGVSGERDSYGRFFFGSVRAKLNFLFFLQIQQVIQSLLQSYKRKEQEFMEFQKKHNIQVVSRQ
ncbi:Prefoldin beta-like protein [Hesseltinella vesiculosa]|uniref:Prefoldin beta-like protein n=1 Tax=Hesseltinella vesiculosa TaxID=101127 RepID=A0A1X2GQI0_9FUNG|nr:Prefoldin beta-like protein [Hesseltinella vesiculosa]